MEDIGNILNWMVTRGASIPFISYHPDKGALTWSVAAARWGLFYRKKVSIEI
jgi:hypothetical protein